MSFLLYKLKCGYRSTKNTVAVWNRWPRWRCSAKSRTTSTHSTQELRCANFLQQSSYIFLSFQLSNDEKFLGFFIVRERVEAEKNKNDLNWWKDLCVEAECRPGRGIYGIIFYYLAFRRKISLKTLFLFLKRCIFLLKYIFEERNPTKPDRKSCNWWSVCWPRKSLSSRSKITFAPNSKSQVFYFSFFCLF